MAKAERKPGTFQPGRSGNPAGKPKGARNQTTKALEDLMEGDAKAITKKAIEKALEGDTVALRLCLERIYPARKDATVSFDLPPIDKIEDAERASAAILAAVAAGEITPGEASAVMALLMSHKAIVEAGDFERRLAELEERTANR